MIIDTTALAAKIKKDPSGAYLFYGEEEYLKRHWLSVFRECVLGGEKVSFNHIRIDGGDISALDDQLSSLPMFDLSGGGKKLIELRDLDFNKIKKSELDDLCALLSSVEGDTVVIYTLPSEFPEGTKKRPSAALAALSGVCTAVCFERQSPSKLTGWLNRHFSSHGCTCSPDACRFLIEFCTPDMFILSSEAEKLCAFALSHGKSEIDVPMIRAVAAPAKSFGEYDLSNFLYAGNLPGALSIVSQMKLQKERPENVLARITRVYNDLVLVRALSDGGMTGREIAATLKINDYALGLRLNAAKRYPEGRLEKIVALCAEADRNLKSTPINKYYLIEDLLLTVGGG